MIGYDVSQAIGSHALAPRQPNTQAVVIDESTVVPGATGEQYSGLAFNNGFVVGTRVERVVPGAKEHQSFGLGLIGLPPEPPGCPAGTKLGVTAPHEHWPPQSSSRAAPQSAPTQSTAA